jgi:hypothetical protein
MHEVPTTKPLLEAPEDDWTVLHHAVLARLMQLAVQSRQRAVSAGLRECVRALQELQALRANGAAVEPGVTNEGAAAGEARTSPGAASP